MSKRKAEQRLYGYDIVLINYIALKGTKLIAKKKDAELKENFGSDLIEQLADFDIFNEHLEKAIELASDFKDIKIYPLADKGINQKLWDIHFENKVGLVVEIADISLLRVSIELTDYYSINPYELNSEGAALLLCLDSRKLLRKFEEEGIFAKVIGKSIKENKVIIRGEGLRRTLRPPNKDSIELL